MENARDMLDQDACYRAVLTRDPRFDGRFFTCVKSTGIYCRPVCPARTPKRENMRFVASAAAAEEGGLSRLFALSTRDRRPTWGRGAGRPIRSAGR
jgi:methylphosphotriester-DNA--protein-cysteine methyltransferase